MARGWRENEMVCSEQFGMVKGMIILPFIGGVEWAEETGGVGGGVAAISFNVLLGFNPLLPMRTGDTIGTTSGCVSPKETIDEK